MYTLEDIQAVDMEVAQAITDELDRQNSHIELIASENWVSPAVMSAMGSVLTNKYAEGYPGIVKKSYSRCLKIRHLFFYVNLICVDNQVLNVLAWTLYRN